MKTLQEVENAKKLEFKHDTIWHCIFIVIVVSATCRFLILECVVRSLWKAFCISSVHASGIYIVIDSSRSSETKLLSWLSEFSKMQIQKISLFSCKRSMILSLKNQFFVLSENLSWKYFVLGINLLKNFNLIV